MAVPRLRWLNADLSPDKPRFNARPIHVEFVVESGPGKGFFQSTLVFFPHQHHSNSTPRSFINPSIHSAITNATKSQQLTALLNKTHKHTQTSLSQHSCPGIVNCMSLKTTGLIAIF